MGMKPADLIIVNLGILLLITLLSIMSGNDFMSNAYSQSQVYHSVLNGSTSTIEIDSVADFSLDPLIQAVIWIGVIGAIGVASGITVLATGLNEAGSKWATGLIFFISIWVMLSSLPFPLIQTGGLVMELIYLAMTITYAFGCIWYLME